MENESLPKLAKKLEKYIMTLPAAKQFNTLSTEPRKAMMALSDSAYNARIAVERYFHADDSAEQAMFLEEAIKQVEQIDKQILTASQYDLVGPVDVAHLSALADQLRQRLK